MYDLRADDAVQLVRLVLILRLLTMAAIASVPVLLFQLARLVALHLWFGSKARPGGRRALSGVREREVELISRRIDPKTVRHRRKELGSDFCQGYAARPGGVPRRATLHHDF